MTGKRYEWRLRVLAAQSRIREEQERVFGEALGASLWDLGLSLEGHTVGRAPNGCQVCILALQVVGDISLISPSVPASARVALLSVLPKTGTYFPCRVELAPGVRVYSPAGLKAVSEYVASWHAALTTPQQPSN